MQKPEKVPVFQIEGVETIDNELRVIGRALETIRVGDQLFACPSEETDADCAVFQISKITMYNREIDEIDRIVTARLFLKGNDEAVLRKSKCLFANI
jgi:hypothetical protein